MAAQFRAKVAYGLSDALIAVAPAPIQALRAPTGSDTGYQLGTIWINKAASPATAYILVSIVANVATWSLIEAAGGAGVFTTLTSTGQTNLATTTASTVNSFGNINGATSVDIFVGTGGFGIDGVGSAVFNIGPSLTTGSINIGGTAQSGAISIGNSSATNTINIGMGIGLGTVNIATGVGAFKTVNIGTGAAVANVINIGGTGANVISIGATQAGGSIAIGDLMVAGSINIGGATQTGAIFIGASTASQTISIGNGSTNPKTILIGTSGSADNIVTIGSTSGVAATTIRSGTGGIFLNGPRVELAGPIYIYTGVGDPAGGLAIHAGDLYIRLDPAGATTRMFIATAAGAWTNFTCAA
jgi:hypothetical protein